MKAGRERRGRGSVPTSVIALLLGLAAAPAGAAQGQSFELTAGVSTWYDNNLLQYSDGQLAQFESGLLPNRFSLESRDDVTFNPSLALTWELDRGGGRRHSLRLRGDGDFDARNPTADSRAASIAWRESFRGGHRLALRGYYLPSYYLRQLRDVSTSLYERAQFSLTIGEAAWLQTLRPGLQAGLGYQIERRVYSPFFPERTSDTHQGELSLGFSHLPNRGALELAGALRTSRADGAGYPGGSASLFPDVSYRGWWAGLTGRVDLGRRESIRFGGDLDYKLEARNYQSDRPADRSHIGRNDLANTVEVGLRVKFRPHWTLRGFEHYDINRATYGGTSPPTTDPGSYSQNLVGIEISWSGDVWRRARGPGADEEGEN